jgi:hypothetical protein
MKGKIPKEIPDKAVVLGYYTSLMTFGGMDKNGIIYNDFWMNDSNISIYLPF